MTIFQYNFPTRIQFGPGAVRGLAPALAELGKQRPLIVTDRGLAPLAPVTRTRDALAQAGLDVAVFSGVWGNPVKSQVTAGVAAFKAHGADSIVGLGGGAAIDVAKAILLMVNHPGDLFDYEDEKPGARPIDREIPYWVSVPTTAGTGSEVGRSTVISDDETHVKKIIFSPKLLAARVFLDPELTLELPAAVTAATGMDALTHLVEAYLAKGFQPLCDGIALAGAKLVAQGLPRAVEFARRIEHGDKELVHAPEHVEARGQMLNAATMGGVAFQKGLGVTHSLAHALSTVCDLHHGLANGIAIPYAMSFNASVAAERLTDLAHMVGAKEQSARGFVVWLEQLREHIGIPHDLRAAGVRDEHLDRLVQIAVADACHPNNPRPVSEPDFRALFRQALGPI
ncbi:MAG TPA: iron-containing alcohol dehydrogenase [Polyangiaceae bacterium]|nr:iron-containing alcohol dehydrogenase [Polyangiaceae bacterium]